MYIYPMPHSGAAAAEAVQTDKTSKNVDGRKADTPPLLRGFIFEGAKASAQKPALMHISKPELSGQDVGLLSNPSGHPTTCANEQSWDASPRLGLRSKMSTAASGLRCFKISQPLMILSLF